jgi:MFS family permease
MQGAVMSPLTAWENFYVIMGTSAGSLTGLTFVVITLVARTRQRNAGQGIAAYTTPIVVQFGAVLLVSALLSAPWRALLPLALLLGLVALAGVLYTAIIVRRQHRLDQDVYTPVLEDWLWYGAFPLVAWTALLVVALLLPGRPVPALFVIGAVLLLLLLFVGIRNAWDLVTYIVIERLTPPDEDNERKE